VRLKGIGEMCDVEEEKKRRIRGRVGKLRRRK
jgi:hypothetical protein